MPKNERIEELAHRLDTVGRDMEDLLGRVTELEGITKRKEGLYRLISTITNEELVISKEVWAWITRRDLDWNAQVLLGKEILRLEKVDAEILAKEATYLRKELGYMEKKNVKLLRKLNRINEEKQAKQRNTNRDVWVYTGESTNK